MHVSQLLVTRSASLLVGVLLFLSGCATTEQEPSPPKALSSQPAARANTTAFHGLLTGLFTQSSNEKTTLAIRSDHKLSFTSYRMDKPNRLALEIRGVQNRMRAKTVPVNDSMVTNVRFISFKRVNAVRIEIAIKMPYLYAVHQKNNRLEIVVTADKTSAAYRYRSKLLVAEAKIVHLEKKLRDVKKRRVVTPTAPLTKKKEKRTRESSIRLAIDKWLVAWRNKNIDRYSQSYAASFGHKGFNRTSWLRDKRRKFRGPGLINVKVSKLRINATTRSASVTFEQSYRAGNYRDIGAKTLGMINEQGVWKIVSEEWRSVR